MKASYRIKCVDLLTRRGADKILYAGASTCFIFDWRIRKLMLDIILDCIIVSVGALLLPVSKQFYLWLRLQHIDLFAIL